MTLIETRRPTLASRRFGYLVGIAVNVVLLYLANVAPGWQAVPFLTQETTTVLALFNASLLVGILANAALVAYDPPWFKAFTDLVGTIFGLAVLVRLLTVFPFAFADSSMDWDLVARGALIFAVAGTVIGLLVQLAILIRRVGEARSGR